MTFYWSAITNTALVPFLSYLTLNNIVTLISRLEVTQLKVKVIQTGTIWKLVYGFLFAFHSSLTMALSCIISEIKRDIGQKSSFFHTPLHSTPLLGRCPSEYCHPVRCGKTRMLRLPDGEKFLRTFRHNTGVWQTDGQTDGRTSCHGIVRAMHTHRAVKTMSYA